jgi:hypothetical protein
VPELHQLGGPSRPRALKDNLDVVALGVGLRSKSEGVEQPPERFIASFGIGQNENGNVHG